MKTARSDAMLTRIAHQEELICRGEAVGDYIRNHEAHLDFMYGPFLRDMQRLKVHGRCLEVGAGSGLFTCMFAGFFSDATITMTDVSPVMMATAKNLIKEKRLENRIEFCICNVEDADVLKRLGKFDFVYSQYVIWSAKNKPARGQGSTPLSFWQLAVKKESEDKRKMGYQSPMGEL